MNCSAWIEESNIKLYHENKDTLVKSCKTSGFKDAVEAIEEFIAKGEVIQYLCIISINLLLKIQLSILVVG